MAATLQDRYLGLRDRLGASAAFRSWAMRFPATRWLARRRARALFDLCAGFVYSQVLLACVRLGLFERLRAAPLTPAQLAAVLGLPEDRCLVLLRAAASLELLEARAGGRFGLGVLGAALLDNPALTGLVAHHGLLYADLADPVPLLQGPRKAHLAGYWAYSGSLPGQPPAADQVAGYSQLMSVSQSLVADLVLDAYPVGRHEVLLDVGGGEGEFVRRALQAHPALTGWVYDLPAVSARAEARLAAVLPPGRWRAFGGDFRCDELPAGADLVTLVRVAHDHDDPVVRALLNAVRRALKPGGRLLLAEPLAGTAGAEPMGDAYFGMYFLAMGSGHARRFEDYRALLLEAGFARVRQHATAVPLQVSVIEAR